MHKRDPKFPPVSLDLLLLVIDNYMHCKLYSCDPKFVSASLYLLRFNFNQNLKNNFDPIATKIKSSSKYIDCTCKV